MKRYKIIRSVLCILLIVAAFFGVLFFPEAEEEEKRETRVVRVWNVDTFEGGKGSRTSFLKRAAERVRKRGGAYYLITSMTAEGAEAAFAEGNYPDILSYGVGLEFSVERSLPLPYTFTAGQTDAGCLAVPWCRGEYALYSLSDDFEGTGEAVISRGGHNLPEVCASLEGIEGEERDSLTAYVSFLNGDYRYLLGTQRDACRFQTRGVSVYRKPLSAYCDLYQYFSVFSSEKREDCNALLNELLAQNSQTELKDIGMLPVSDCVGRAPSALASKESLEELSNLARKKEGAEKIPKFLKTVEFSHKMW